MGVEHPYAAAVEALEFLRARWSEEEERTSDPGEAAALRGQLIELDNALARLAACELFHLQQERKAHRTPERPGSSVLTTSATPNQPSPLPAPR